MAASGRPRVPRIRRQLGGKRTLVVSLIVHDGSEILNRSKQAVKPSVYALGNEVFGLLHSKEGEGLSVLRCCENPCAEDSELTATEVFIADVADRFCGADLLEDDRLAAGKRPNKAGKTTALGMSGGGNACVSTRGSSLPRNRFLDFKGKASLTRI